jgi:hypothetical protein
LYSGFAGAILGVAKNEMGAFGLGELRRDARVDMLEEIWREVLYMDARARDEAG